MSFNHPSHRPSTEPAQLERCQICSRLVDHLELQESIAHPGLLACSRHPDEFEMGHREFLREGMALILPEGEIVPREEPIGMDINGYALGEATVPTFMLREDGYPIQREGATYTTFLREESA